MALNTRQRITIITMDILLIAELVFCIYYSHGDPDTMPVLFLRTYVPLCLVTLFACRYLVRRFESPAAEAGSAQQGALRHVAGGGVSPRAGELPHR